MEWIDIITFIGVVLLVWFVSSLINMRLCETYGGMMLCSLFEMFLVTIPVFHYILGNFGWFKSFIFSFLVNGAIIILFSIFAKILARMFESLDDLHHSAFHMCGVSLGLIVAYLLYNLGVFAL